MSKQVMRGFRVGIVALSLMAVPVMAQVQVDPDLPEYKPVSGISGSINSIGSDSMNNLMALWGEGFRAFYPNVTIEIEGKGSSTAPVALIAGSANFGPMSRPMKAEEIDAFEEQKGYPPFHLPTSMDMLAVYVNKDNPIKGMSLAQVDSAFSKTRRLGLDEDLTNWGQLGLTGEWASAPISLYGRNSASGTYGFFKENAMGNGDFRDEVKEQPGSSSVVQGVASDKFGIGYSGIGYRTADVIAIPLAAGAGDEFFEPEAEHVYSGDYPLARFLYVYIDYQPGSQLDPLRREVVKYIFSKQGQEDVVKDGYVPIPASVATETLEALNISLD